MAKPSKSQDHDTDESFIGKPLVLLEWHDSNFIESGWNWIDDQDDMPLAVCRSVGWIVYEDKTVIRLAGSLNESPEPAQMASLVTIPASAILRRRKLISSAS